MPETVDLVLRTITIMAAVLLAGLLLSNRRNRPAALPGAFLCFAIAAFFLTSGAGSVAALGDWRYLLTAICVTKAVWFWLFARALFNDDAQLDKRHYMAVTAVAIVGSWQQIAFLAHFRAGTATWMESIAGFGFEGVLLLFVLLGLYEAWRGMSSDLVERRRRLRVGFIIATGAYLSATLGVQSYNLLMDVSTPLLATRANMLVVAGSAIIAAGFLLQFRSDSWLQPARTTRAVALNGLESSVLTTLERKLESERIFLQEGLTIGGLARHLGTDERVLRQVINRGMGHRNFNDFLHAWRVREACEELARPEQARLPVLSIAMKVGYGSVGAFNRAFKARIGMTPTDYRRDVIGGASPAT